MLGRRGTNKEHDARGMVLGTPHRFRYHFRILQLASPETRLKPPKTTITSPR